MVSYTGNPIKKYNLQLKDNPRKILLFVPTPKMEISPHTFDRAL